MPEHFCTYFDHRYAAKGVTMWRSLKTHRPDATLHVLCLTEACHEILRSLRLPDVHLHRLRSLEADDPSLVAARGNRSLIEYYFTLTPCFPLYIVNSTPDVSRLTYVDADLFFFADPQPIFDEIADGSIGLIEHRFPEALAHLSKYGCFNVGWLTFRNNSVARSCLKAWREQCLEWCYDRLEDGRFAEQKYLDNWPAQYPDVAIVQHKGANVAPWNLGRVRLSLSTGDVNVDGERLLFFHAHGFEPAGPGRPRETNLKKYRVVETPLLLKAIFEPYEKALLNTTTAMASQLALALISDQQWRETTAIVESLKPRISALEEQLLASDADRAARLDVIHSLQQQLAASETDRAARLDVIHSLEQRLAASETDRAARLDVIHSLEQRLAASEADRAARFDVIHSLEQRLTASETDRAARLDVIHSLEQRLTVSETDRVARLDVIQSLEQQLTASETDRAARLDVIHSLDQRLAASEADRAAGLELLQAMELSRSWRWTRPFRWMLDPQKPQDET
jgi:hypothetical protein